MHEIARCLTSDVDAELERIITELAVAQRTRREAVRRQLRRQIIALLREQGFSVGDIFPAAGRGRHACAGDTTLSY